MAGECPWYTGDTVERTASPVRAGRGEETLGIGDMFLGGQSNGKGHSSYGITYAKAWR